MEEDLFWKYKIVQFFHDPPGKPYAFFPRAGGHWRLAQRLFRVFTEQEFFRYPPRPDRAASGADRPVLSLPRGVEGGFGTLDFHNQPLITHPLTWCPVRVHHADDSMPITLDAIKEEQVEQEAVAQTLADVAEITRADWGVPESLRRGYLALWRRYREELIARQGNWETGDLLWERMPGDSRCPDHSIWEHLRVATALAFLDTPMRGTASVPESREPWLFTLSLAPVQQFITESRTSRDLWISSFLLSDLAWHAMLPVVECYGPDCIMYPDLRGNPRVDVWLAQEHPEALPEYLHGNPSSFAATLPHTFTAVLPRGGQGCLIRIEDLAARCAERVQQRWATLADVVHRWLEERLPELGITGRHWQDMWQRQHHNVFHVAWNAARWRLPERQEAFGISGALPCQDQAALATPSAHDIRALEERRKRLAPWVPAEIWSHYELAREVFGLTHAGYLQDERGFDYALTHHQLRQRHRIRKEARGSVAPQGANGEKCTLCHRREALWDPELPAGEPSAPPEQLRQRVRQFWSKLDEDGHGSERLCAICATKRFLVEADGDVRNLNFAWAGPTTPLSEVRDADGKIHVPFPSTATIAAQEYLATVATHPALQGAVRAVVEAYRRIGLPETAFARALPRLAAVAHVGSSAEQFLRLDSQLAIFPHIVQAEIEARKVTGEERWADQLQQGLLPPVAHLHQQAEHLRQTQEPQFPKLATRVAVVLLDGDQMGRLLLGDPEMIDARWRDVLHPSVVERIGDRRPFIEAGWNDLLETKRLIGPSLHAFISRALADFAHQIVPWVVEREFGGRLIYAGGDDILALAPADDALPMAARLQQLFSAPWVVDTRHTADPWEWRRREWRGSFDPEHARQRFAIPRLTGDMIDLRAVTTEYEAHVLKEDPSPRGRVEGRMLGLLGPRASLSAAIVYAHFKTPMATLLNHARALLEDTAKREAGRRAVALSHFSRNGPKSVIAMKWDGPEQSMMRDQRVAAHRCIALIREGFTQGTLPGRLPYKLREVAHLADVSRLPIDRGLPDAAVLEGLLRQALERPIDDDLRRAVLAAWQAGFLTHPEEPQRSVEGLLLCRALSRAAEEDDA